MEFCTEQEVRVVVIKNILPQCLEKQSENVPEKYLIETSNLSQKEHVKVAARQVEDHTQRQLKLLEQLFELETQKIKEKVLVVHKSSTLVEHQNLLNGIFPKGDT